MANRLTWTDLAERVRGDASMVERSWTSAKPAKPAPYQAWQPPPVVPKRWSELNRFGRIAALQAIMGDPSMTAKDRELLNRLLDLERIGQIYYRRRAETLKVNRLWAEHEDPQYSTKTSN